MRILVVCEFSARVRDRFRLRGHDAWSCDLRCSEGNARWHIQGDALRAIRAGCPTDGKPWDMVISHAPCQFLANSGVRWLRTEKGRWKKMRKAAGFFRAIMHCRSRGKVVPKFAGENPIMHRYARRVVGVRHTQSIQPWQFGTPESKRTCLWLRGLPSLKGTRNVFSLMMKRPIQKRNRVHHETPGPEREKNRSRTFAGIAAAMAAQWG